MLLADLAQTFTPRVTLLLVVALLALGNAGFALCKGVVYNRGVIRKKESPVAFYLSSATSAVVGLLAMWLIVDGGK